MSRGTGFYIGIMAAHRQRGPLVSDAGEASSGPDPDVLPLTLALDDPRATDAGLAGAKAANLARSAVAGFAVVPGFVLTTAAFDPRDPGWAEGVPPALSAVLRSRWETIAGDGAPLVVRSSSTVEDIGASSMAGQFLSVLEVVGWEAFIQAVRDVQRSSLRPVGEGPPAAMAVLVQRQIDAKLGGVLFGLDPVSGNLQHILVEAVPGGPEDLVSGSVTAQRYLLGRRGRLIEAPPQQDGEGLLDRRTRRSLASLAARGSRAFGRAQDIEWAIDGAGHLWLLQTRPVTAVGGAHQVRGPLLGPGPIAETFPEPLRALEVDLWIPPLRSGLEAAISVTGAVSQKVLAGSPVLTTVHGRVACDLELLGASPQPATGWRLLDPRAGLRRLINAWRIGRLRAVLPELASEICRRVDRELAALPALEELSDAELLETIERARRYLVAVHGHEVLAGAQLQGGAGSTAAAAAMTVVGRGKGSGLPDDEIIVRWPVALALSAPRIGPAQPLPPPAAEAPEGTVPLLPVRAQLDDLPAREALRLRARWLQELSARAAGCLGRRLADAHRIPSEDSLVQLRLSELADIVAGWPAPADVAARVLVAGPPLPSCFRLTPDGTPVRVRFQGAARPGGRGASEGRAQGTVVHDPAMAEPGDVLVTRTLDPRLAGWLPTLGAVVSETGSVLSHLAILAREYAVPTVVSVHDAVERFGVGTQLLVDGTTGEVRAVGPSSESGGTDGSG